MTRDELKELISEYNPEAILFDDLDGAIIGVGQQHGMRTVVIYDSNECIHLLKAKFMKEDPALFEWDAEEQAREWFSFNVECAYLGPNTPIFLNLLGEYE